MKPKLAVPGDYMKRLHWIDELRGFAILLVVAGHLIGGLDVDHPIRTAIYLFHMPLLFIISGSLAKDGCCSDIKQFFTYLLKIVIGIYVPYLFWGFCFWAGQYFIYMGDENITLSDLFRLPYDNSGWIPGWFLLALFGIRIIELIMDNLFRNSRAGYIRLIIWLIFLLVVNLFDMNIPILSFAFESGVYYEIGRIIGDRGYEVKIRTGSGFLALLGTGAVHCCIPSEYQFLTGTVIGVLISLILIKYFRAKEDRDRSGYMETLGKYSMIPYTLHAYFTIPIKLLLLHMGICNLGVYVILGMASCIVFCLLVIKLIERYSVLSLFFYPAKILNWT